MAATWTFRGHRMPPGRSRLSCGSWRCCSTPQWVSRRDAILYRLWCHDATLDCTSYVRTHGLALPHPSLRSYIMPVSSAHTTNTVYVKPSLCAGPLSETIGSTNQPQPNRTPVAPQSLPNRNLSAPQLPEYFYTKTQHLNWMMESIGDEIKQPRRPFNATVGGGATIRRDLWWSLLLQTPSAGRRRLKRGELYV
jgi:hypothetical protein